MKATPLAALAAFALAALCAFAPGAASAQVRDNVYAVGGVQVDETAANAAAAQQAGFAAAQRLGFDRLVRRLTAPEQLAATPIATPDAATLDRLVLSVDVEEERRSATRYIGRLSVRFDPNGVRTLLRSRNLNVIDTRTAPVTVIPDVAAGTAPEIAALWREVWSQGAFGDELVPLIVAAENAPQAAGSTLTATLRVQGSTATAALASNDGSTRRDRGEVAARLSGTDTAALRVVLASLADQASTRLQNEWKARANTGASVQRGRISASALYTTQAQWERIKQGLEGAAQTVISEIRIEAVGREGALVSFSFMGDPNQLTAELQRRGVRLEQSGSGPVLRAIAR